MPLHNDPYGCPECHSPADIFGDHQVGCSGNGDRVAWHNAIRDVVFLAAQSAALAPSKETPNLLAGSAERPADVLLPNWCQGKSAALDIHVISPLQSATVAEAAYNQGYALDVGVRRKLTSNLSTCRSAGVECIPMVAETLGGLASDCISTIRAIGSAVQARSGSPEATNQLFGSQHRIVEGECSHVAPQTAHIPARAGRAHLTCFTHYIVCPLFGVIYFCLTLLYIFKKLKIKKKGL